MGLVGGLSVWTGVVALAGHGYWVLREIWSVAFRGGGGALALRTRVGWACMGGTMCHRGAHRSLIPAARQAAGLQQHLAAQQAGAKEDPSHNSTAGSHAATQHGSSTAQQQQFGHSSSAQQPPGCGGSSCGAITWGSSSRPILVLVWR